MKYHTVQCKYCGTDIQRASYYKDGTCFNCKTENNKRRKNSKKPSI